MPKLKTLEQIFKEKGGYEVVGEVKGADMVGWPYDGPFDELPAQTPRRLSRRRLADSRTRAEVGTPRDRRRDVHRVVAWKDVGETEGTGIVHIAPGCGKEDFHLGKEQGLPPVAPLDESGVLPARLRRADRQVRRRSGDRPTGSSTDLKEKGLLFAVEKYPHSYPHCWRCKTELLFRLVDEWFIGMGLARRDHATSDGVDR